MTTAPGSLIAISGASGLIGGALVTALRGAGATVLPLVRHRSAGSSGVYWDPERNAIDSAALEGVTAVVHLAGAPIAERWSAEQKRRIRESRVQGTRLLATALAGLRKPPTVM